jgi:peptide/nickel transport system ATP-binding protein
MYLGSLVEQAPADALYEQPLHPYTRALMSAVPVPDPVVEERRERILLAGDLPSPANPPNGCRFHTRCPWRQETRCDDEVPALRELAPGRLVSCHWAEEIRDGLLWPKSAEEVAATQGVTVAATGAASLASDSPVGGVDQPIERI